MPCHAWHPLYRGSTDEDQLMAAYVPIVGLFALAALFGLFSVAAAPFICPRRFNRAKLDAYECGMEPTPHPIGGGRFPVTFYLTAMLFIIFDIEIIFLYPWAVSYNQLLGSLGVFAFVEMILFILTV